MFGKKQSKRMLIRKVLDHAINLKKICTKEKESLPLIQSRERRSKGVYKRADEKGVYLAIKVTPDYAGIFYWEEGQKEKNGTRLPVSQ